MMFTRSFASLAVIVALAAQSVTAAPGASWAKRAADLQTSLALDPSQVQPGLANDGQSVPEAGQVPSLTSKNNFINFCATQNVPLTNGLQVRGGSCNPTIIGRILPTSKMPSSKFVFPANLQTLKANTKFTIQMKINNIVTGNFVNPQSNYYAAPQHVDASGTLIGHSHVAVEKIDGFQSTTVTDPNVFAFFKGLNTAAQNGILSADVNGGLPEGVYRMASINAAANHQPVLVAVAQHGSLDDGVYFEVTADGKPSAELSKLIQAASGKAAAANNNGAAAANNGNAAANNGNAASSTPLPAGKDGKLQLFTGSLGGAPPDVVPQGKSFAANGQTFADLNAARKAACETQNQSCTGLVSGKKATTAQCTAQSAACRKANGI